MEKFIILKLHTGNYIRNASTENAYALKPYKDLFFLSKEHCRLVELPPSLDDTWRWCLEIPEWYADRYENVMTAVSEIRETNAQLEAYIQDRYENTMRDVRDILNETNKNDKQ